MGKVKGDCAFNHNPVKQKRNNKKPRMIRERYINSCITVHSQNFQLETYAMQGIPDLKFSIQALVSVSIFAA
jgi:hypothetical protein